MDVLRLFVSLISSLRPREDLIIDFKGIKRQFKWQNYLLKIQQFYDNWNKYGLGCLNGLRFKISAKMSAKYFKIQEADKNVRNFRNVRICLEISDIFLKVKNKNVRKL